MATALLLACCFQIATCDIETIYRRVAKTMLGKTVKQGLTGLDFLQQRSNPCGILWGALPDFLEVLERVFMR